MSPIGFIGLGIMGKPMSKHLLKAGRELIVYDVVAASVADVVAAGAQAGKSLADVAARCATVPAAGGSGSARSLPPGCSQKPRAPPDSQSGSGLPDP